MKLEFPPYETAVPTGVGTELVIETFAQSMVIIDTKRGAIRLGG